MIDVGLNDLKGLRPLHSLLLYDTRVTEEAAANLERESPQLTVGRIEIGTFIVDRTPVSGLNLRR